MAQQSGKLSDEQPFNQADKNLTDSILTHVHDGMHVLDRNGKEVGKVDAVYFGEVNEKLDERGEGAATAREQRDTRTVVGLPLNTTMPSQTGVGGVIPPGSQLGIDNLPDVVRNRLLRLGFIRIGGGILHGPRYVLPEQIATVQGNRVNLNIASDELIKS